MIPEHTEQCSHSCGIFRIVKHAARVASHFRLCCDGRLLGATAQHRRMLGGSRWISQTCFSVPSFHHSARTDGKLPEVKNGIKSAKAARSRHNTGGCAPPLLARGQSAAVDVQVTHTQEYRWTGDTPGPPLADLGTNENSYLRTCVHLQQHVSRISMRRTCDLPLCLLWTCASVPSGHLHTCVCVCVHTFRERASVCHDSRTENI